MGKVDNIYSPENSMQDFSPGSAITDAKPSPNAITTCSSSKLKEGLAAPDCSWCRKWEHQFECVSHFKLKAEHGVELLYGLTSRRDSPRSNAELEHRTRLHSCRKTFETLVERDGHILENVCKRNNEKLLEGLTKSQKSRLIDKDQYDLGETTRWRLIWCTVLPDSEEPGSPYLDRGDGLKIFMIRDF
ncbi:Phospholipase A I [Fusarium oxysporum f. sp. albedinis]|nr:Phospholipase A I [Fusarium oxysporum f. sp. albedinis]